MNFDEMQKANHFINTIRTEGKGLSKWEEDFVDSIEEQFNTKKHLSPRQMEILENIYAEKTN